MQRLQDRRYASRRIAEFVHGLDFASFSADERTAGAVLYALIVLGEAAKGISAESRAKQSAVSWRAVAGMKDIATHQ